MLLLGLDPGSVATGFGLVAFEHGELRWRRSGLLRPARGKSLSERLLALHQGLSGVLAEERPDQVALEESFVGRHVRSALILGHARGALIVSVLAARLPLFEYAPRLIKRAVTGTGGATKEQVRTMVVRLIAGAPAELSFDEADALAVAICHAHRLAAPVGAGGMGGLPGVRG